MINDSFFSGCYRDFSGEPSTTRLRFALDDRGAPLDDTSRVLL